MLINQHSLSAWLVETWRDSLCQKLCMASLTVEDLVTTGENQTVHPDELAELGGASLKDKAVS